MTASTSTAPPVTTRWVLDVPIDLPSKNAIPRNPHARRDLRNRWAATLATLARQAGIPLGSKPPHLRGEATAPNVPRRSVAIVRLMGRGQRPYDLGDGMQGGAAMLRDAMQVTRYRWKRGVPMPIGVVPGAGIVWDDSARWSVWTYAQERAPDGKPGVRIEITETAGVEPARSEP